MGKKIEVNPGRKFGRWTVINEVIKRSPSGISTRFFNCKCDCGVEKDVQFSNLREGKSVSCGCFKDEIQRAKIPHNKTTGLSRSYLYSIYGNMKDRCYNPNCKSYHNYGERGIVVCDRWLGNEGFKNFYADMGHRPDNTLALVRKDNNGPYSPGNCIWADQLTKANNTTSNVPITLNGVTKTIAQWSRITGIGSTTILYRKNAGKSPEECLSEIKDQYKNSHKGPKNPKPKDTTPKQQRKKSVANIGDRFGRLVVTEFFKKLAETGSRKGIKHTFCRCICDCGGTKEVLKTQLCRGDTNSCGCITAERNREMAKKNTKTGLSTTSIYKIWSGMKARCYNKNKKRYKDYGGRGITVCDRWLESFENFFEDMGERPSPKHTLDRIRNNEGYGPDNCQWADTDTQANNKRNSVFMPHEGRVLTIAQWSKETGLSTGAIRHRLENGHSSKECLMSVEEFKKVSRHKNRKNGNSNKALPLL